MMNFRSGNQSSLSRKAIAVITTVCLLFQTVTPAYVVALTNSEIEKRLELNALLESLPNGQFRVAPFLNANPLPAQNLSSFYALIGQSVPTALPDVTISPLVAPGPLILSQSMPPWIGGVDVQNRLIRGQIRSLLGVTLILTDEPGYQTELEQINTLYGNAVSFAASSNYKLGDRLGFDQTNAPLIAGKPMIWPELRTINGSELVVPVVYLDATTYSASLVDGAVYQLDGAVSLGNLVLSDSTIRFGKEAFLTLLGNLEAYQGELLAAGDFEIRVGGELVSLSSLISAGGNLVVAAESIESKTLVHRYDEATGHTEFYGEISEINAAGDIVLRAYEDISLYGTEVTAGEKIIFAADGNIYIGPTRKTTDFDGRNGGWKKYQRTSVRYLSSTLSAEDSIEIIANGRILIDASEIVSDEGHIELLAQLGISVVDSLNQTQKYKKGKFGKTKKTVSAYKTVAIRTLLDAGKDIILHTEFGDINLRASDISSEDGTTIRAKNGAVNLLATRENDHYSYSSVKKSLFTTKTVNKGHEIETIVPNAIVGGLLVDALNGISVEFEGDPDLSLREQVSEIARFDEFSWMLELLDENASSGWNENFDIDWAVLEGKHREWYESKTSLSPALVALVSIAVAIALPGPGVLGQSILGSSTATSTAAIAVGSASISLITTATIAAGNAVVNGDDPFSAAFEAITDDETLKSAAIAALTAGALNELDADLFNVGSEEFTWGEQAVQVTAHSAARAGIQSFLNGGDFEELFIQNMIQNEINTLGRFLANEIGTAFYANEIDKAVQLIAHAGVGCVLGIARSENQGSTTSSSNSCVAGAGGAVVGEIIGDLHKSQSDIDEQAAELQAYLKEKGLKDPSELNTTELIEFQNRLPNLNVVDAARDFLDFQERGVNLAVLGAGITALLSGASADELNIATDSAENAAENNAFMVVPMAIGLLKAIDLAITANELYQVHKAYQISETAGNAALAKYFGERLGEAGLNVLLQSIPGAKTGKKIFEALATRGIVSDDALKKATKIVSESPSPQRFTTNGDKIPVNTDTGRISTSNFSGDCPSSGCKIDLDGAVEIRKKGLYEAETAKLADGNLSDAEKRVINNRRGDLNEDIAEAVLESDGYTVGGLKYGTGQGRNGIDRVAFRQNPDGTVDVLVVESKILENGGTNLSKNVSGDYQLSDDWLDTTLGRVSQRTDLTELDLNLLSALASARDGNGSLKKVVAGMDKKTGDFRMFEVDI